MAPLLDTRADLAPPSGSRYPDANALVDGFLTPIGRVPENAQNLKDRETIYHDNLKPQNFFHAWVADDTAVMTLRIERCARMERRERDRVVLRAEMFWDDDRALEAAELGERIRKSPAKIVARLKRTPHGCDWLIARWEDLAHEIRQGRSWTPAHHALAFDLLGKSLDFRNDPITDGLAVATREIALLKARREAVAPADALDRTMVLADLSDQTTPELRRLRRYEATLHKRLRWNLHQLQITPKHVRPNPELRFMYEAPPAPPPTPEEERESAIRNAPRPKVAEPGESPVRRPDPERLKAEARRQAKQRRADRLNQ